MLEKIKPAFASYTQFELERIKRGESNIELSKYEQIDISNFKDYNTLGPDLGISIEKLRELDINLEDKEYLFLYFL